MSKLTCCPDCASAQIKAVSGRYEDHNGEWYCRDCKQRFDEPARREANNNQNPASEATVKLLNADPDEYP